MCSSITDFMLAPLTAVALTLFQFIVPKLSSSNANGSSAAAKAVEIAAAEWYLIAVYKVAHMCNAIT
jgi:hypothetical protein